MKRTKLLAAPALIATVAFVGCGKSSESGSHAQSGGAAGARTGTGAATSEVGGSGDDSGGTGNAADGGGGATGGSTRALAGAAGSPPQTGGVASGGAGGQAPTGGTGGASEVGGTGGVTSDTAGAGGIGAAAGAGGTTNPSAGAGGASDGGAGGSTSGAGAGGIGAGGKGPAFRVVVHDGNAFMVGHPVAYADAAGSHLVTRQTDDEGSVVFDDVPLGGHVTVYRSDRSPAMLRTVAAVEDGDVIHFGGLPGSEATGTFSLELANPPPGGTTAWVRIDTYAFTDFPFPSTLTGTLRHTGPFSVLAEVYEGADRPIALGYLLDLEPTGVVPNLHLTGALDTWNVNPGRVVTRLTNEFGTPVDLWVGSVGYRGEFCFNQSGNNADGVAPGASAEQTRVVDSTVIDWAHAILRYDRDLGGGVTGRVWQYVGIDAIPDDGNEVEVALRTSTMMPEMSDATFDPATRTVTTGLGEPPQCNGTAPDALTLTIGGDASSTGERHYWEVQAPFGASLTFPELDDAILAEAFPDDTVVDFWRLRAQAQSDLDYDDLRNGSRAFPELRQQLLVDARSGGTSCTSEVIH